jgi:hypothetical protein
MQVSVKHGQRPVGAVLCCREHGFEERTLRHPVGPFLTGTRLDFAKNRRRGWDSNPQDASRRLAVFKTGSILRPGALPGLCGPERGPGGSAWGNHARSFVVQDD